MDLLKVIVWQESGVIQVLALAKLVDGPKFQLLLDNNNKRPSG